MTSRVKNVFAQADRVSDLLAFYTSVLGSEPLFVDGERWAQFSHGGVTVALAGSSEVVDGAGRGWVLTLEVPDLAEAERRALEAGGVVHARRDLGGHGTTVIVRDAANNATALWTPAGDRS
jgi:predicted enzyme related to lactoylglutathione lyase